MEASPKDKDNKPVTEGPLSEKDEVKKAEDRTRKAQDKASVASELKIRSKDNPDNKEE
ncbi:hypothetical protein [Arcticibacter tournemirensis]|uniref:hypothetical protein n=1 Tax=Arcticibacter tournemirensis TaxID=699437 RepID=UPI0013871DF5|nr:hypothetical protein [Arcticibacter tournemirensis]